MLTFITQSVLVITCSILLYKTIMLLYEFAKNKKEMYFLTRTAVKKILFSITIFSIIYILSEIGASIKNIKYDSIAYLINNSLIISLLLYLIFAIKKK